MKDREGGGKREMVEIAKISRSGRGRAGKQARAAVVAFKGDKEAPRETPLGGNLLFWWDADGWVSATSFFHIRLRQSGKLGNFSNREKIMGCSGARAVAKCISTFGALRWRWRIQ